MQVNLNPEIYNKLIAALLRSRSMHSSTSQMLLRSCWARLRIFGLMTFRMIFVTTSTKLNRYTSNKLHKRSRRRVTSPAPSLCRGDQLRGPVLRRFAVGIGVAKKPLDSFALNLFGIEHNFRFFPAGEISEHRALDN
jgi:hypothetical protein